MSDAEQFDLNNAIQVLKQTPYVLARLLGELPPALTESSGEPYDWALYDVLGHLIHGEETDWIPRAEIIVVQGEDRRFVPFDRTAQFERSRGRTLDDLLIEFGHLRNVNIEKLIRWQLKPEQLDLKGIHPEFGEVTLRQLLATWVVHDLNHIQQIVRYIARQYSSDVGPWKAYLSVLD